MNTLLWLSNKFRLVSIRMPRRNAPFFWQFPAALIGIGCALPPKHTYVIIYEYENTKMPKYSNEIVSILLFYIKLSTLNAYFFRFHWVLLILSLTCGTVCDLHELLLGFPANTNIYLFSKIWSRAARVHVCVCERERKRKKDRASPLVRNPSCYCVTVSFSAMWRKSVA